MSDEQKKPEFYWFQTKTNPYALRIQAVLEEAERHQVPLFRIADMLRELADSYNPKPPPSRLERIVRRIRFHPFGT